MGNAINLIIKLIDIFPPPLDEQLDSRHKINSASKESCWNSVSVSCLSKRKPIKKCGWVRIIKKTSEPWPSSEKSKELWISSRNPNVLSDRWSMYSIQTIENDQ